MAKKIKEEEKKKVISSEKSHKNKSLLFMICGIVLIVVLIVVGCFIIFRKGGQEASLSKSLKSMGKDYYENFYYEQVGSTDEERAEFLSKFESIGIKINLDNLSRSNNKNSDKISEFVNQQTKKECDKTNTKVIIYPQKPYNKTSYKIETQLDCGFDETSTK